MEDKREPLAREELLDALVERDPVVGVAESVALGIGVGLVLDTVFFERRHREFEVQEGRPDVAVPVLDENRRGDVFEAGEGLGLVVDLGPLVGEAAVAVPPCGRGCGRAILLDRGAARKCYHMVLAFE